MIYDEATPELILGQEQLNQVRKYLKSWNFNTFNIINIIKIQAGHDINILSDQSDDDSDYSTYLINKPDVTKEELAAAYLTVFYDCNLTQFGLSTIFKLSNITSGIKLPTNFDGLLNLLTSLNCSYYGISLLITMCENN